MTTVNYDRAVAYYIAYYDETRAFRSGVSEQHRQAVLPYLADHDNPRILELAIAARRMSEASVARRSRI